MANPILSNFSPFVKLVTNFVPKTIQADLFLNRRNETENLILANPNLVTHFVSNIIFQKVETFYQKIPR